MSKVKLGKYKHYKNKFYNVIDVAIDSDTLEEYIVYRALYDDSKFGNNALWVRKKSEFLKTEIIDGREIIRYEFVEE
jgi:cyclomaltodextrinase / maltogenic alpha-amylase / neopullulanase